ncbi:MAG: CehA/McbA family metallohydrolase, partial [Gammaproteobacteria bacterium]
MTICRALLLLIALASFWAQESTNVRVTVRERKTGLPVPARVYLTDGKGAFLAPPGAITYEKYLERHFVSRGSFELRLTPGIYRLIAERGPEYRPSSSEIDLKPDERRDETLSLERWIDMNALGWYSGDLHNHRKPDEMPDLLLAEALNLAPTLTDWIWEERSISRPPSASKAIREVDPKHVFSVLDKEVERLESGPGAVALVGLRSVIPFDGYRLHPPNDAYTRLARAQGGYVDAEKILWRDVAALVALEQIDFAGIVHNHFNRHTVELETERWGMIPKHRPEFNTIAGMPLWSMDVYYRFLNCGFRLAVSAGSASGVKAAPLGYNRVYVKMTEPFGYAAWLQALKAGRSFATNGPMLFFTVNGQEPGAQLAKSRPDSAKLRIRAEALSAGPLERLEIIHNGRVLRKITAGPDSGRLLADFELSASEGGWLAARCFEQPGTTVKFAHTSPVYLQERIQG